MTFDEMARMYLGEDPNSVPGPPMPLPAPDVAGGGAESNNLRHLWDYAPPTEQIRTQFLQPNFAENYWQMASYPGTGGQPRPAPSPYPSPEPDNYGPGWSFQRALHTAGQKIPEWAYAAGNDIRRQVLSDEDLAEIRRDPTSWQSLGAYGMGALNAGIMLSRGAGGKGAGELPKMAVPNETWANWKVVKPGEKIPPSMSTYGDIRVDHAGNHFQEVGTHESAAGEHVIVQPVEQPGYVMGPEHNLPVKESEKIKITQEDLDKQFPGKPVDPESLSIHDPSSPHYDQNFTDWFKKVYPEDFDDKGSFIGEGWKPPEKTNNPYNISDEEMNQLKKEFQDETDPIIQDMDAAQADYMKKWGTWDDIPAADKAKISKPFGGEMGMDEGDKAAAAKAHWNPQGKATPEEKTVWDEWSKQHGGQKPNFSEPPPSIGDDFPEMPPGVSPKDYWKQFTGEPQEPDFNFAKDDPAAFDRLWHHPGDKVYPEVPEFAPGEPVQPMTPWEQLPPEQRQWYIDQWAKGILPPRTGQRLPPWAGDL